MSQVTLKEIYDAIENLRGEIKDTYVSKDKYDAEVGPLKEFQLKAVWILVSSIIIAVINLIVSHPEALGR